MRISVYIPSFNQKDYLVEAVDSVLAQTLRPHQIIIADDCSTDGSREVIEAYRVRYPALITPLLHERNTGIGRVRIDALGAVTGDYVTYIDGDDRFLPGKLEKEAALLEATPGASIAFSNYYYIDAAGERTGVWAEGERPPEGDIFKEVFGRAFPRGSLFRSELVDYAAWKKIGFHDQNLNLYEDYEMRIRLTKKLKAAYHDEPLSEYRLHDKGLSRAAVDRHIAAFEYIMEKNRHLLDDLGPDDRGFIEERVNRWLADFSKQAARQSIGGGRLVSAAKYFLKSRKNQGGKSN